MIYFIGTKKDIEVRNFSRYVSEIRSRNFTKILALPVLRSPADSSCLRCPIEYIYDLKSIGNFEKKMYNRKKNSNKNVKY